MTKLKLWAEYKDPVEAEKAWEEGAKKARDEKPLKKLKALPDIPGITKETKRFLKLKSLYWMIRHDAQGKVFAGVMAHPFKYLSRLVASWFKDKPYLREGDFFYYGLGSAKEFEQLMKDPNTILLLGFSYCHKPFECPSGRFSDLCISDKDDPVCRQCFIGKMVHASPDEKTVPLFIPTVHYIGAKVFEYVHKYPEKQVIFLITACEMTLEMFGDWGNMAGIKGVGVRLDGRICNTMRAFALSEKGIKPGLTVVLDATQKKMFEWISLRREAMTQ